MSHGDLISVMSCADRSSVLKPDSIMIAFSGADSHRRPSITVASLQSYEKKFFIAK